MTKRLAAFAAVMLSAGVAHSADIYQPQPEPLMDAPEVSIQESSGWYLRGDVGYSFNKLRGAKFFQGGTAAGDTDFRSTHIDDSFLLGGGVGYQINNYLRTDLTVDYLTKSDFRGSTTGSCGVSTDCFSRDRSSFSAYSVMANVYVDLGTYAYFTPYVGAGFGASYVKWGKLRNTSCATGNPALCDDTEEHGGKGKWRATAALMAGATIDVTCAVKADVGYRFRYIDGGDMFGYTAVGGGPGRDKGIYSHEARIGARYMLGGCDAPVSYEPEPQPLVYK